MDKHHEQRALQTAWSLIEQAKQSLATGNESLYKTEIASSLKNAQSRIDEMLTALWSE